MSWFDRSIANTLKLDDEDDEQYPANKNTDDQKHEQQVDDHNLPQSPGRGVKEDLSEITETLTRQFWGVASLLAHQLPHVHSNQRSESSNPEAISGIRRDLAEIGGRFRSGISKLSDVSEITKIASNFLQMESEDEECDSTDGAVGVKDEVVTFARDIAMHPETWLDFPLLDDEGFDLSDVQQEHALAVESLAPRLSALRIQLCPAYMSESSFWKIYFVVLHPILEPHAAELLSTPKIVKARASLTHELKNRSYAVSTESANVEEAVKHPIHGDEIQIVEKSVIQEGPHQNVMKGRDENETDGWLKEENPQIVTDRITIPIENDDVSFSDLDDDDDDDDGNIPIHYKNPTYASDSSTKDWLDVVDIDVT